MPELNLESWILMRVMAGLRPLYHHPHQFVRYTSSAHASSSALARVLGAISFGGRQHVSGPTLSVVLHIESPKQHDSFFAKHSPKDWVWRVYAGTSNASKIIRRYSSDETYRVLTLNGWTSRQRCPRIYRWCSRSRRHVSCTGVVQKRT